MQYIHNNIICAHMSIYHYSVRHVHVYISMYIFRGELSPIMTCPKIEIGYNSRAKCSLNILIFSNGSVQKPEEAVLLNQVWRQQPYAYKFCILHLNY